MNWYFKVLKQYADFSGRARRKEYWMFILFNFIISVITSIIDKMMGLSIREDLPFGYVSLIYALLIIIPALAVSVRRLHDIGKSGWWIFIALVPIIGGIWLLILHFTNGQAGTNEYGPDPKV